MSVYISTDVWKYSKCSGSPLLIMLAIADNANDDGHAWPGVNHLATKTRLSRDTVMRSTGIIEVAGELVIHRTKGRGNQYLILTGCDEDQRQNRWKVFKKRLKLPTSSKLPPVADNATTTSSTHATTPVAPTPPDPSRRVKEPSKDIPEPLRASAPADRGDMVSSPTSFTVLDIQKAKLTRTQWETLLENERLRTDDKPPRLTVIKHCEKKLKAHRLEPHRERMLAAMNAATLPDIDDPQMRGAFGVVLVKLWPETGYYRPEEVEAFAQANDPLDSVHFLPSALSSFRAKTKAANGSKGSGPGGRMTEAEQIAKYSAGLDYKGKDE